MTDALHDFLPDGDTGLCWWCDIPKENHPDQRTGDNDSNNGEAE